MSQDFDTLRLVPGGTLNSGFAWLLMARSLRDHLAGLHGLRESDVHVCAVAPHVFYACAERHYESDGIPVTEVINPLPSEPLPEVET